MSPGGAWLSCILCSLVASLSATVQLRQGMPNVCPEQEVAMVGHRQPCVQAFTRLVTMWKQDCAVQRWCMGYERRTAYYTIYKQVYSMEHQTTFKCCPGWHRKDDNELGCLHVLCSADTCFNGGKCSEGVSQVCQCSAGFQGPRCQFGESSIQASVFDFTSVPSALSY
ncbi:hypothetical protein lerEdw1_016995 [Lerista edwardsae]|nr:hypothetical protein lerEdw1_016995 [Lerista edwardsae]